MKKFLFMFVFCLILTSFRSNETVYYPVSIIELIADPKQYKDLPIGVAGFIVYEFEHQAIYFTSESAKKSMFRNGIRLITDSNTVWKSRSGAKVNILKIQAGQSVSVNGIFEPDKYRPSYNLFSGSIAVDEIYILDNK